MGRAPCCEKVGLKTGAWSREEDEILTSYIQQHGHPNWRALPKQAGLLRCGKSCRLRWINYLRPDIKRGNFSTEEEDTIIKLHDMLGNRWSAIAAKLPGRTDNEIKNVWHTNLKKRLPSYQGPKVVKKRTISSSSRKSKDKSQLKPVDSKGSACEHSECDVQLVVASLDSPPHSSYEASSVTSTGYSSSLVKDEKATDSSNTLLEIDESFWSETLTDENSSHQSNSGGGLSSECAVPSLSSPTMENVDDSLDFWYDFLTKVDDVPEMLEFEGVV